MTPNMQEILTLVNSGGVVAVLVIILRYFVSGKVVSRALVRSVVLETVQEILTELEKRGFYGKTDSDT